MRERFMVSDRLVHRHDYAAAKRQTAADYMADIIEKGVGK